MNITKTSIVFMLLIFLLLPVSIASDGDYTIGSATKDINVLDDGTTKITEDIIYDIEGKVNGVYRDIPIDNQQSIENISVETPGYYNTVEVITQANNVKIKVWLYTDAKKTQKVSDESVEVIYHYNFIKGVKIYNDIAELQYMSWGDGWDSGVDTLETTIHIPGNNQSTQVWNNPNDLVNKSYWTNDDTLVTKTNYIDEHTTFEQRILMPTTYFKSTQNAKVIDMDAKEQIEKQQKEYENNINFQKNSSNILSGLFAILMILPLGIYALFGREPKIDYKAEYEPEPPTNDTPLEVNVLVKGNVGEITLDALFATILDLIDRKYFKVISSNKTDTIIRFTNKTDNLKKYELDLINYLQKFRINNEDISLKSISSNANPHEFKKFEENWKKEALKQVPKPKIDSLFNDKGASLITKVSLILFAIGALTMVLLTVLGGSIRYTQILWIIAGLMIPEAIILWFIPNTFGGRWTPEGKEYNDKWNNFKNYLKDYSLIKERPPASIQVWGRYLVYASALGCADEVSKNMKKYFDVAQIPEDYYNNSDIIIFSYYYGLNHMGQTFNSLVASSTDTNSIGSAGGGGFGGGGGGTF